MRNLQALNVAQRRLVFFLIFGGVIFALIAVTWWIPSRPMAAASCYGSCMCKEKDS